MLAAFPAARMPGLDGQPLPPFKPGGRAGVLFFVSTDCPISNTYAPTMASVCREYAARNVSCTLVYEDLRSNATAVRQHAVEYQLGGIPATLDTSRALADRAKVEITPTAVVTDAHGEVRYQGRIDNRYINIGRTRQVVSSHDLIDALEAVLDGKAVRQPHTEALGCYIERR